MSKRFSPQERASILRGYAARTCSAKDFALKNRVSITTIHSWRKSQEVGFTEVIPSQRFEIPSPRAETSVGLRMEVAGIKLDFAVVPDVHYLSSLVQDLARC